MLLSKRKSSEQLGLFTLPLFQQFLYPSHQHAIPHLILVTELAHFVKVLVCHPIPLLYKSIELGYKTELYNFSTRIGYTLSLIAPA